MRKLLENGTPERLSIERHSPFHWSGISAHIGVRVNGLERNDIREYHATAGWVVVDKTGDRETGVEVEPYWRIPPSRQIRRQLQRLTNG